MNNNRVAALAIAVSLMTFAASLVAEETIEFNREDAFAPALKASGQEITVQLPAPETAQSEPDEVEPAEKFLTEFKIYPAF